MKDEKPEKTTYGKAKTRDETKSLSMIMEQNNKTVSCHMFIRKTVVEKRGRKMDKSKIYHFTGIKDQGDEHISLSITWGRL